MSDQGSYETIDQVLESARQRLDHGTHTWAAAGAGAGSTVERNQSAIHSLALVPHVGVDVSSVDTATSFAGISQTLPVFLAPVGALALYDGGDSSAAARAAAGAGISAFTSIYTPSSFRSIADTSPGRHVFQLYVMGDRAWQVELLRRVEDAGFGALCVTMDTPVVGRRDASIESGFGWSSDGGPDIPDPGLDWRYRSEFEWTDLAWLAAQTSLPVIAKGIMTADDAVRAVDSGADVVYVSNHGGRMVDQSLSTIEALPTVVDAIPDVDVVIDSGFTRGAEVCKAVALGARAVGIGRLQCWALAAGGEVAVSDTLRILHDEIRLTMANVGRRSIDALGPDSVAR